MFNLAVFALASAGLYYLSRASLRVHGSHGSYRFFVWEVLLALILLSADGWFQKPWTLHDHVAMALLVISAFLAIHAFRNLRRLGKPSAQRKDESLMWFERTTVLVTTGAYKYIRHPIYGSLLWLAWGLFLKISSCWGAILSLTATLFLVKAAKADEAECLRFFGPSYAAYMRRTKMFLPFLF